MKKLGLMTSKSITSKFRRTRRPMALAFALLASSAAQADPYRILWWDSTPEYSGQAPNALRQEMSDYLTAFDPGLFNSIYVGSESAGTLATHLATNSYDVIVFDATSANAKFNALDLAAVQAFYTNNNRNLLLDGNLYVRSINFNSTTNFPGINGSTGGLTVNQVFALASRGGGLMIGTDHDCCQTDANQILNAILGSASFSGNINPSTDGVFTGTELLNVKAAIAPADLLAHYSSIPSQGIAPTGAFTDFLGGSVTLYSQLDIAGFVGGPRNSFISTSFAPSGGVIDVDDPDPPPPSGAVPEPATWAMMIVGFGIVGGAMRRRQRVRITFA